MPPELTAVLAALEVQASPGGFAAAERLLGGSFSGLAGIRRNPVATIDAAGLTGQEVRDQLSGLPIGPDAELHVAWIAERLGARMSFATFAANAGDLWFRAMDDIACVLYSAGQLMILVLDHEELITLSRLGASQAARHPGHAGQKRRVRDSGPGSLDVRFRAINSGNERSLTVTHSVGAHKGFGACEEEEGRPGLRTVFAARSR